MRNFNTEIWEGWTIQDFIDEVAIGFEYQTFENAAEIKQYCKENQPYYKKHIPEVFAHFLMVAKNNGQIRGKV